VIQQGFDQVELKPVTTPAELLPQVPQLEVGVALREGGPCLLEMDAAAIDEALDIIAAGLDVDHARALFGRSRQRGEQAFGPATQAVGSAEADLGHEPAVRFPAADVDLGAGVFQAAESLLAKELAVAAGRQEAKPCAADEEGGPVARDIVRKAMGAIRAAPRW
jgi:hypothetical protein